MMIVKRIVLISLLMGAAAYADHDKRPNVIVILADDMRYDGVAANGNAQVKTPNLNRLAERGSVFDHAYLQGANTGATCVASRAQLLCGRGVFRIEGGKGSTFAPSHKTIAQAFSSGGYFTFITGKSHNQPESAMRGFQGGARLYGLSKGAYYVTNKDERRSHFGLSYQDYREDGQYDEKHLYLVGLKGEKCSNPSEIKNHEGLHSSDVIGQAAVDFIQSYDRSDPFFLYLPFHAPHDPRQAPAEYLDLYPPESIALPSNFLPKHPFDFGELKTRDEKLAPYPRTKEDTQKQLSEYYAIITHMDAAIGRVFAALKERGLVDNTIVVFTSDSGLAVGSHGLFGKQNLYDDGGTHVPMIMAGPGVPSGKRTDSLMYTYDLYPTLCDLTGVSIPDSVTGVSQKMAIEGNVKESVRDDLYFGFKGTVRAVCNERFKLIEYAYKGKRLTQLFDLENDPDECTNLADNAEYAQILNRMRKLLEGHRGDETESWRDKFWEIYNGK
ncbi:sulfatase-like hydrolase/transferase [Pontiella sulfatireligans]|uniref:Arylsulfatase n=1 Tax=Pontiella sulfatireligans TaxID=2750658 RepID=A0A6C2UHE3_9BACT|nr:sulfatase-like hydrolase/transferase [Pontiella sulfatireligans]SPS74251.1 sulfatase S1_28 [Kiritimatiellales bacterium]VGO18831.1 Arylsulfatase [Pontiella sulfatireligans]